MSNKKIEDDKTSLFTKVTIPKEDVDFLMSYFKIDSVVKVNQTAIYMLKNLAQMEKDGYKFAIFKDQEIIGNEAINKITLIISDMVNITSRHIPSSYNNIDKTKIS